MIASLARSLVLPLLLAVCSPLLAADSYRLDEPIDDTRVFGVGARVEVTGSLETQVDNMRAQSHKLYLSAGISYRERRVLGPGAGAESLRAVREYEQASSDIDVGGNKTTNKLADPLKIVICQGRDDGMEMVSLGGPLSSDELSLLTMPGDTLTLAMLLPGKEVSVGDTWEPAPWVLPLLTATEAVVKSELKCEFQRLDGRVAVVGVNGTIEGATLGASSKITLTGTVQYDLDAKSITQADLVQTEKRAIGAVSPGLDLTARVRLLRKVAQVAGKVGDNALAETAAKPYPPTALRLRFEPEWNFSIIHARDWNLYHQTENVAIFRLLDPDDGIVLAQCNVSPIPPAQAGSHTPETDFQNDIKTALGDKFTRFLTTEQIPAPGGRFVYHVIAIGKAGDRTVAWIYYLVADPSGQQVSLVFATEAGLLEKLKGKDREFVDGVRFRTAR